MTKLAIAIHEKLPPLVVPPDFLGMECNYLWCGRDHLRSPADLIFLAYFPLFNLSFSPSLFNWCCQIGSGLRMWCFRTRLAFLSPPCGSQPVYKTYLFFFSRSRPFQLKKDRIPSLTANHLRGNLFGRCTVCQLPSCTPSPRPFVFLFLLGKSF